jgi:hypothetical protein
MLQTFWKKKPKQKNVLDVTTHCDLLFFGVSDWVTESDLSTRLYNYSDSPATIRSLTHIKRLENVSNDFFLF